MVFLAAAGAPLGAQEKLIPRDPTHLLLRHEVGHAIDKGLEWLKATQSPPGYWDDPRRPVTTAKALEAFMNAPGEPDREAAWVGKGYAYLESCARPGGGISGKGEADDQTAVCVFAFAAANRRYDALLGRARAFLLRHPPDKHADMWELEMWLKAVYHTRQKGSGNTVDYRPLLRLIRRRLPKEQELSPDSVSYMALLAYRFAGLKPDDPRVKTQLGQLRRQYLAEGDSKLGTMRNYFFSETVAETLTTYGIDRLKLATGSEADWAGDLAKRLINLQRADGSWEYDDPGHEFLLTTGNILALEIIYRAL